MRQTLFYIPHELFSLPLFGFGWMLIAWGVLTAALLVWLIRRQGFNPDTASYFPVLLIIGVAITFLVPMLEEKDLQNIPLGLPIRGYGVMLMLGTISAVGLAVYRSRQVGLDTDILFSLVFWMFLVGIAGARIFFVVQYWESFQRDTIPKTIFAMISVTEGGLVVYGSLIGGLGAGWLFMKRNNLPVLAVADILAPSMLLGLALGRIGCLLNGCCFGGICEDPSALQALALRFPKANPPYNVKDSPPYQHQRSLGQLHGIHLGQDEKKRPTIRKVDPNTPAAESGIEAGKTIQKINGRAVKSFEEAQRLLANTGPVISIETLGEIKPYLWSIGKLPPRSRPVHPSQIYSAINAALMCIFLWVYFPFRRRDGEVIAMLLMTYPIARTLLEMIRNDEPGRFNTSLTISQWVSGFILLAGVALWVYLAGQPRHCAYAKLKSTA